MPLNQIGRTTKGFRPQPFEIQRGSHGLEESVESGAYSDKSNRADRLFSGELEGEVRTPPFINNYNDGFSFDSSSKMEIEGRVAKHWTKTKQELDFTIKDADAEPNLRVLVTRDFSGHGRLEIRNRGEHGGDGQIDFPLGNMSKWGPGRVSLASEQSQTNQVRFEKDAERSRIEVQQGDGTQVYVVQDGLLFREEP